MNNNSLTQKTDNQLVQEFNQGTNRALEILIGRYKDKLFSSILFIVKDKYLAEDLFQDAFIKIIETIRKNKYKEEGKFLPWATRIAHNLCVDHFRKINRTPVITIGENTDIFELFTTPEVASDVKIVLEEGNDKIRKVLELLPDEQREIIVLRHYADLSFKEIAELSNCSINTCLGRMRYGLINLRKLLEERKIVLQ